MIGGLEEQKRGRNKGKKKLIVLALDIVDTGVGRAYAEVIEHASAKEIGDFMVKYVAKETKVITDEWRGYSPLKKMYTNLEQVKTKDGKKFKDIHIHIMNIKGWLRGIHHHSSEERIQSYLNEYHYRYNRRENTGRTFNLLIKKMIKKEPIRLISTS